MLPLYAWAIAGVYLPSHAPGLSVATLWAYGAATALLLVASVLVHEFAHAIVARTEGLVVEDITLHFFGGLARMSGEPPTPRSEFRIAVVGPGASFALGVLFLLLDSVFVYGTTLVAEGRVLRHLGIVNLVLATFNLLPGYPLDGGHVLRAFLWRKTGDPLRAMRTARGAGRSIAIALVAVGAYVFLFTDRMTGLWAFSFGVVLLLILGLSDNAWAHGAQAIARVMRRPAVTLEPSTTVHALVHDVLPDHRQTEFLVASGGRLLGFVSLDALRAVDRDLWKETSVGSFMHPVDETIFVGQLDTVANALAQARSNGIGQVAVIDRDGLVVGSADRASLERRDR
ncbi:MAG: site-2 protease family protein [Acidobacteria bacterium]|nr:site-2 protease family protein [Acidobacteriota bacterium]